MYEGKGAYTMHKHKGVAKHFSMLAGGTGENCDRGPGPDSVAQHFPSSFPLLTSLPSGITPCYAVMVAALKDPEDITTISLLFANQTEDDILLKTEIDELQRNHPNRLQVYPN